MSFNLPERVPSLGSGIVKRAKENEFWQAKKSQDGLPLYKDKPYKGSGTGNAFLHSASHYRKRRTAMKGCLLVIFVYALYFIGSSLKGDPRLGEFDRLDSSKSSPINWKERQGEVKKAFVDSWAGYEKYAWGKDVYKPLSKTGENMGPKPLGWIIVDALDTMHIMDLKEEIATAKNWIKKELTYDFDYEVNTFETTIRMLGGFLSAFYLSTDDLYLDKATDLGNRLLGAFDSKTGIPYASINLKTGKGVRSHVDGGASSTAEASTLQLEFKYLSKLTGEALYWEKAEKVAAIMDNNHPVDGLVPIFIHPDTGKFQGNLIRLGSRGDSYYEYLLKQYLQTNKQESIYSEMYQEALRGIKDRLIKKSYPNHLTYIGELPNGIDGTLSPKMDHLVCFMGGQIALGATEGIPASEARKISSWSKAHDNDLALAEELTKTCHEMYAQTKTGLAPEIVIFNSDPQEAKDFIIKPLDRHNLQRPETVESLFILWRITKDEKYRQWGWEIFESFLKYTKVDGDAGFTSLDDVTQIPPKQRDNMESFWLAETLKYLYLLFDDSEKELFPLDKVVFNTEAHPFPNFDMDPLFTTGWFRAKVVASGRSKPAKKLDEVAEEIIEKEKIAGESEKSDGPSIEDIDFDLAEMKETKEGTSSEKKKENKKLNAKFNDIINKIKAKEDADDLKYQEALDSLVKDYLEEEDNK